MEDITEDPGEELQNEETEGNQFTDTTLIRVMSILFVIAVYFFIFLKILFLE